MANEGVIKFQYPISGLGNVTAKIRKADDTIRDGQSAVPLTDSGHAFLYTNSGSITIQPGDSVLPFVGSESRSGGEYRPESRAVSLSTTVAAIPVADIEITLTNGSADDDAYNSMVLSITQASTGDTRSRRIVNYIGSSKRCILNADFEFAITAGDAVIIWADTFSQTATVEFLDDIVEAISEILPIPNRFASTDN